MPESTLLRTNFALDLTGGDVWAWEKWISGSCAGMPADATIAVRVNCENVAAYRTADRFVATVRLQPGPNEVVAVATLASGEEFTSAPVTHTVRLTPRPVSRIEIRIEDNGIVLDGASSAPSDYDRVPIASYRWSARPGNPETIADPAPAGASEVGAERMTIPAPATDGEYYVSLEVLDAAGRSDTSTACFAVEQGEARVVDPVTSVAPWVADAVVYGMVVRNFTDAGFRGVTARMSELAELGVTAIWLAPITRTFPGDFGYAVTDYFDVRPEYGTLDDFRDMVREAHSRGIRVLMDFVPNHTSDQHPYFEHAKTHRAASPYFDWYDRDADGTPTHYFQWKHLPNLNFDNPDVRRFMTEAFAFWMRECDVDGFRVDVAWGIKERRPDYWLGWSAELNRIKPDSLLIAEASARDPFYVHNGFDAAYDWTDDLGVWAWTEVFTSDAPMSTAMPKALTNHGFGYDPDSLILRFLNNNDTGERFISTHGVGYYRVAMAMLMTLPGIPCVYTGDEVGAPYKPYETASEIAWDDPHELRPFVRRLIEIRRGNPSLFGTGWRQLEAEPSTELFAYVRESDGNPPVAVVLNFSDTEVQARLPLPAELARDNLTDIWSGERIPGNGESLITSLPAWGFRMLMPFEEAG